MKAIEAVNTLKTIYPHRNVYIQRTNNLKGIYMNDHFLLWANVITDEVDIYHLIKIADKEDFYMRISEQLKAEKGESNGNV